MFKVVYKIGREEIIFGRYSDRQRAELASAKLYNSSTIQATVKEEADGELQLRAVFPTKQGLFLEIDHLPKLEVGQPFKYGSDTCMISGIVARQEPSGVTLRNWTMR